MLNERYKVKKMIGGGGMANVYLARDIILDRDVAIKVLRLEYANDDEFIARFHREAQSATSLSHPNIVNIYDVGEEDNIYYMVMEYVDGMTLKKYIQTYGPVEVQKAIDIMKQVTSAIIHAHENDIVHRDIKPQNILIDPFGLVKVTDFGIAIALSATSLTQTNSVLGSVHYLSPEQARGGMANKKSDVYSLGIVFFELLSGRLPFSGQSAVSIALKHLQSNTPSIRRWNPDLPQSVENIVLKSTTKDPFHRYSSVYEMEEDLETALDSNRVNEELFNPPEDSGEATKAIPVITDSAYKQHQTHHDTIVHDAKAESPKDSEVKHGKKKRKKAIIWVSAILFVLFGAIIAALFILPSWLQPDDVEIPDVTNMEYEKAISELSSLNLNVEQETRYSDEVEEGYVIKTDPEAGEIVKEGRTVTVFSSDGKEKVTFDDYVGQDYYQLERVLRQAGYNDITIREKFSDKKVGEIIEQYHPQPGALVIPEETSITFDISKGLENVTLNNLVGMTQEQAMDYLANENLSGKVTDRHSANEPGRVIEQSPSSNTEVEQGSEVQIVVSTGPEEKKPRTKTVRFTIPYTGNEDQTGDEETGEPEPQPQVVRIYVEDAAGNNFSTPVKEETITENKEFEINLLVPPDGEALYKVERDDKVVLDDSVRYEDVEG
nr:Stk1 family PASTA domain-containing Ser/Thr kinase [Aquibacillus saliphilus]